MSMNSSYHYYEQPRRRHNITMTGPQTCWYHLRFGNAARRCESPCDQNNPTENRLRLLTDMYASIRPTELFMVDEITNILFLIDTGSELCIFPRHLITLLPVQPILPTNIGINVANGSTINSYGMTIINIKINDVYYPYEYIIADSFTPIIGLNFLSDYSFVLDCKKKMYTSAFI